MVTEIKLNQLRTVIEPLDYPVSKREVLGEVSDVRLQYADGDERLEAVVDRSNVDVFETVGDLEAEVYSNLALGAVGEPGQSEGEG